MIFVVNSDEEYTYYEEIANCRDIDIAKAMIHKFPVEVMVNTKVAKKIELGDKMYSEEEIDNFFKNIPESAIKKKLILGFVFYRSRQAGFDRYIIEPLCIDPENCSFGFEFPTGADVLHVFKASNAFYLYEGVIPSDLSDEGYETGESVFLACDFPGFTSPNLFDLLRAASVEQWSQKIKNPVEED